MKYYIYISDAKVDMLFPQVPHDIKKKVALEFKTDIKIFSASRKSETETEDNRIARLEAVVNFIREYGNLGTVDEPDQFIEGTMPMHWGQIGVSEVVIFTAVTDTVILGLGGSHRHVIGSVSNQAPGSAGLSATPHLLHALKRELGLDVNRDIMLDQEWRGASVKEYFERELSYRDQQSLSRSLEPLRDIDERMPGPRQSLEFFAKRLIYDPGGISQIFGKTRYFKPALLATPLYVALAD